MAKRQTKKKKEDAQKKRENAQALADANAEKELKKDTLNAKEEKEKKEKELSSRAAAEGRMVKTYKCIRECELFNQVFDVGATLRSDRTLEELPSLKHFKEVEEGE